MGTARMQAHIQTIDNKNNKRITNEPQSMFYTHNFKPNKIILKTRYRNNRYRVFIASKLNINFQQIFGCRYYRYVKICTLKPLQWYYSPCFHNTSVQVLILIYYRYVKPFSFLFASTSKNEYYYLAKTSTPVRISCKA